VPRKAPDGATPLHPEKEQGTISVHVLDEA
jgi:hypothetical protein